MSAERCLPILLIGVLALTACPPPEEQPAEEPFPAPEMQTEREIQQDISVLNETPDTLTVVATIDGREEELGTVPPQDSASFSVTAMRGGQIQLEARDPTGQVVQREMIEAVEIERAWRVSPGAQMPGMTPGEPGAPQQQPMEPGMQQQQPQQGQQPGM